MTEKKPPKYTNTPYGRVLTSSLGKGIQLSEKTKTYLETTPNIPGNTYYIDKDKKNVVKTASTNNYVEEVQKTKADFSIEERVAFMALTGTEILEVSRNFNMSSNSLSLNKNVLDSVNTVNAVNPIELIKIQNSNTDYIAKSSSNLEAAVAAIVPTTGNVTVTAPAVSVLTTPAQPATTTTTSTTPVNTNQVKVEVQTPTAVVTQTTTPPHKIISFTPTSGKKGSGKTGTKITVTHEKCNTSPRVTQIGNVNVSLVNINTKTITFYIPDNVLLVIGQQYKISITIGGIKVEAPGTLTITA